MLIHVRYDEIALKGKKRPWFEQRLRENVARMLDVPQKHVKRTRGRLVLDLPALDDPREALEALGRTFGVASAGVVRVVAQDLAVATDVATELAREAIARGLRRFKVESRRADKSFPLGSLEVSFQVGSEVHDRLPELIVDVHEPEFVINVEVREEGIALYTDSAPGPRGVPTGTGGSGLCLLSGGIDSPVGAWYALKRGLHTDHIYFHAFPYTGDQVKEKVLSIARVLARWTPKVTRVFVASTTRIQDAIAQGAPENLRIVLLRRSMYRIAAEVLRAREYQALVTGESLGQVASQTPENLRCVEAVVPEVLVLRPLVGLDKHEIVALARKVGTFETSVLPYQDCCSLFAPKHPETHASLAACEAAEAGLELTALEGESLAEVEVYRSDRGAPFERLSEGLRRNPGANLSPQDEAARLVAARDAASERRGENVAPGAESE